jgi:hypothetical protein
LLEIDTWKASKRGSSCFPSINEGPPLLISHLFFAYCYYAQISPISPILFSSSFLLKIFGEKLVASICSNLLLSIKRKALEANGVLRVFLVHQTIGGDFVLVFFVHAFVSSLE